MKLSRRFRRDLQMCSTVVAITCGFTAFTLQSALQERSNRNVKHVLDMMAAVNAADGYSMGGDVLLQRNHALAYGIGRVAGTSNPRYITHPFSYAAFATGAIAVVLGIERWLETTRARRKLRIQPNHPANVL